MVLKAGAYWQVLKLIWISKVHNSYLLRWAFFSPLQKHLKSRKFQKYYSFLHRGMVRVCSNQFDRVRLKRKDCCFQSIWVIRVEKKKTGANQIGLSIWKSIMLDLSLNHAFHPNFLNNIWRTLSFRNRQSWKIFWSRDFGNEKRLWRYMKKGFPCSIGRFCCWLIGLEEGFGSTEINLYCEGNMDLSVSTSVVCTFAHKEACVVVSVNSRLRWYNLFISPLILVFLMFKSQNLLGLLFCFFFFGRNLDL